MSLDWPVHPFGRSDSSGPLLPPDAPSDGLQRVALPASERSRWREGALQAQPQILQRTTGWDGCGPFLSEGLRCITWNTRGLVGSVFSRQRNREFKLNYLKKLLDHNNIICLQEVHGKDEFLEAIQVLGPRFRLFGTFLPDNENAGGSAICIHRNLLSEDAIVTHVVTCQGRDHLVNIRSGQHSLVIVNVHFEPELTSRQLRGRLGLTHPHWPTYPRAVGVILGEFKIGDPEEGRFNVWNPTFTDGDPGKTAVFHSFFPYVLEVAQNLSTPGEMPRPLVLYAPCQGLIVSLSIYLWLRHVISTARLMLLRTLGRKLFRVTMLQYASSSRNLLVEDTRTNVFPVGYPNTPFFGSILQQLHDDHSFSPDPFCALAEFRVLLHNAKEIATRELLKQTPDCIGAKLFITSTALRAYRNRHVGTLMRCCEAWKPIEDCFDTLSFECIDFQRLSQIFASLTRENLETREAEVSTLPWTQTEKDMALARRRNTQRA